MFIQKFELQSNYYDFKVNEENRNMKMVYKFICNENELYVHTKSECPICHRKIMKEQLGGRGTYYCQSCQK